MIKLSISLRRDAQPWHYYDKRWQSGESWIEPLTHSLIEHRAFTNGDVICIAIRERHARHVLFTPQTTPTPLSDHAYQEVLAQCLDWPLDVLIVEIAQNGLTVRTGATPVAPVYLAAGGNILTASWDLSDLRTFIRSDALVDREVARQLSGYGRYGHETLFKGVYQLTAGSTAVFDYNGLQLAYAAPAAQPLPRRPAPGADLVGGFERLLHDALSQRPIDPDSTAVQLSGGQDSAMVALSLGVLFPQRITSCAMMLPGLAGEQQALRREVLASAAQLAADVRISALEYPPLVPAGPRMSQWRSSTDEPYLELLTALVDTLKTQGIQSIVTGFGGDELMLPKARSHSAAPLPNWLGKRVLDLLPSRNEGISPATAVPETTLMALASVAPTILRAGMWLIAPLAGKTLTWFANCLPHEWRVDKRLMRQRLTRLGLPQEVVYPRLRENFTSVMGYGLHHYGAMLLRRFAADSHVVSSGYIDPVALRYVAQRIEASIEAAVEHRAVFAVLAVELCLQQLT